MATGALFVLFKPPGATADARLADDLRFDALLAALVAGAVGLAWRG